MIMEQRTFDYLLISRTLPAFWRILRRVERIFYNSILIVNTLDLSCSWASQRYDLFVIMPPRPTSLLILQLLLLALFCFRLLPKMTALKMFLNRLPIPKVPQYLLGLFLLIQILHVA